MVLLLKEDHKEGDVWEENGKKWTIKDGIKQTHTKLDNIKKEAILPLFCPNCKTLMKDRNDTKMYKIHKKCFDCVIKEETKLRMEGKYEEYERNLVANNMNSYVDHLEAYLLEAINESNTQFVSERGEVERWKGGIDKNKLEQEIKTNIAKLKEELKSNKKDDQA